MRENLIFAGAAVIVVFICWLACRASKQDLERREIWQEIERQMEAQMEAQVQPPVVAEPETPVKIKRSGAKRATPQKPFRPRSSQSERAAQWEHKQTDAFKKAAEARQKKKESNHGNDDKKR